MPRTIFCYRDPRSASAGDQCSSSARRHSGCEGKRHTGNQHDHRGMSRTPVSSLASAKISENRTESHRISPCGLGAGRRSEGHDDVMGRCASPSPIPSGSISEDIQIISDTRFFRLWRAASTVSFKPTALVTATSVESRGFPRADNARYKLSRSMPAALATLAMPPLASRVRPRTISSTAGSCVSSNAALSTRRQT